MKSLAFNLRNRADDDHILAIGQMAIVRNYNSFMVSNQNPDNFVDELFQRLQVLELKVANLEMVNSSFSHEVFDRMATIVELTQPHITLHPLSRIGDRADGGYVIARLPNNPTVLSIGVGENISSDLELIHTKNATVFAFDPFVEKPLDTPDNFHFHKIGYAATQNSRFPSLSLKEILKLLPEIPALALIDIEGSEWGFVSEIALLQSIPQLVIEFHNLTRISDANFYKDIKFLLDGLSDTHFAIHVHANNAGHTLRFDGCTWPDILEITFLSKSLFSQDNPQINFGPFPTPLDFPNTGDRTDINLEVIYGKNSIFRNGQSNA